MAIGDFIEKLGKIEGHLGNKDMNEAGKIWQSLSLEITSHNETTIQDNDLRDAIELCKAHLDLKYTPASPDTESAKKAVSALANMLKKYL